MKPMMACGCAANATDAKTGKPCCIIHSGLNPGADTVVEAPDLTGRKAACCYGDHNIVDSSVNLAFFKYKPNSKMDEYYCGCYGWD